jgi:HAE1 family hydrophobic/amphiphilic exporter-1
MALYDTSIRRPVATTMSFLVVIVVGAVSFYYLPVDLLPEIEYPQVSVTTSYPNVGPEEMEQIITDPVANAVSSVSNVERITSQSSEGSSRVNMEFGQGTDLNAAANDVRAALDRIRDDLPVEAEPPSIRKFDPNSQEIVSISVESRRDLPSLTRLMERNLSKQFEQIPGVGTINVQGGIYRQVQVNLNRERLMSYDLSAAQVQQSISSSNVALPGGNVKEGLKDLYVRTQGEYESLDEIRNTVVTTANGTPVRVQDVAEVIDGYEDLGRIAELNGIPVLRLDIQKRSGANTVSVANRVREEVKRVNQTRSDLNLTVVSDQSDFIRKSINNVQSSAIWGSLLAILVLYLFLRNGSTTFIIALSIPISIIATFALLFFNDLTLNQMTFGGLALGDRRQCNCGSGEHHSTARGKRPILARGCLHGHPRGGGSHSGLDDHDLRDFSSARLRSHHDSLSLSVARAGCGFRPGLLVAGGAYIGADDGQSLPHGRCWRRGCRRGHIQVLVPARLCKP